MFFVIILTGQDSLMISDVDDCINSDYTYNAVESEKIKTRFQKYILEKSIDSIESMSVSSQIDYFNKLYKNALTSSKNLELALTENDWDKVEIEMCNLGNACGTCHASFRRLLTSQLANEASAWSGKYINKCN